MVEIATAIQEGALAYLRRQFKTILVILVPLAAIVFVTSTEVLKPDGTEALSFFQSGTLQDVGVRRRMLDVRTDRIHRDEPCGARKRSYRRRGRAPVRCRPLLRSRSAPEASPGCSRWAWVSLERR